ncbi:MAG TPA: hypothetical protein VN940_02220 [Candidatus Dormibacteraeota bacterium]|nr:hypothetical protein [Candidatus Dormibacteraeota bacterium]
MRRAALLAGAVIAYMVAAWMVAPGFYDGFGPVQPYKWTCPPPQAGANEKPGSGHATIKVVGGVSEAASVSPDTDGQLVIGFLPGAFDATGKTTINVDITPLPTCPQPPGIQFVTNVYQVTAPAPLVKPSPVALVYSNLLPAPTAVYFASDPAGPWRSIGAAQQSALFTIDATTSALGYFAAGYPSASPPPGTVTVGGGQVLPIVVAIIIVLVVLAGLPLALMRRRRSGGARDEEGDD